MSSLDKRRFNGRRDRPLVLSQDHWAVVQGVSLFHNGKNHAGLPLVREPIPGIDQVLKPGQFNSKLGARITNPECPWVGMAIFYVGHEERATCPPDCLHWQGCLCNGMAFADRWIYGEAFRRAVNLELEYLSLMYPSGFALRLHVSGDFTCEAHVGFWRKMIETFPALHTWGYTAHSPEKAIGRAIDEMNDRFDRWRFRFSGKAGRRGTVTLYTVQDHSEFAKAVQDEGAFVCPATKEHKNVTCGSCGRCMSSTACMGMPQH